MKRSKQDEEKLKQIEEKRRKLEEEKQKKEEERLKREEEKRKREEEKEKERLRKEEEKKKREEERLKREEEKKRLAEEKEQERLKKEEERRKKLEEKEQERLKREEEKRKKDEERKQKEEEKERERLKREEERKQKEEEKERDRLKREEERLKKEQEKLRLQEEAERKKLQQASFLKNFLNKSTTPTRKSDGKKHRPEASTSAGDDDVMEISENDNPNTSLNDDSKIPSTPKSKFRPFQVKNGMALAPLLRRPCLNSTEKTSVDKIVAYIDESSALDNSEMSVDEVVEVIPAEVVVQMPTATFQPYLESIKKGSGRKSQRTEVLNLLLEGEGQEDEDEEIKIIEVDPKKVLNENIKETGLIKWRYKLLQFHDNNRPAYWGTWKRKSNHVNPRRPLGKDQELDYEFDSDDEWEDEPEDGEDLGDKDDDDKAEDEKESSNVEQAEREDDDTDEDDWMVPHGYLSDDEGDGVEYRDKDYLKSREERFYQDLKREEKLGLPVVATEHDQLLVYEFIFPPEILPDAVLQESEDDSDEE